VTRAKGEAVQDPARLDLSPSEASADPATVDPDGVPARFALAVGRLNRLLRPARPELSHGLLLALSTVVRNGPIRPSRLGQIEGISAPSATRAVDDLERRGLVERVSDPDDGRSFFVSATASGLAAVRDARQERAEHAAALLDELDAHELERLVAALPALERVAGVVRP
jgi:DNA-binding MarR family transcriptional regulator